MYFIRDYIPFLLWLMGSIPCNTYENVMESVATRPTKIGVGLRFGLMAFTDFCSLKSLTIAPVHKEVPERA